MTLVVALVAGCVYGWISRDWSEVAFYGGFAGVIALVGGIGLPWMEHAPDDAWRRRPQRDLTFPRERLPDWRG